MNYAIKDTKQTKDFFLNRELALLTFNQRVLAQAQNTQIPLLERLRYICIVSSNLDEFFEVRIAGLKEQIASGSHLPTPDGYTPETAFKEIATQTHNLIHEQYSLLNNDILPLLKKEGIVFLRRSEWNKSQSNWIKDFFTNEVKPILTPIGLDSAHPFPKLFNKSLNFAIELEGKDGFNRAGGSAIVQIPRLLPRVIKLPKMEHENRMAFVFLSSIMHQHVDKLFPGMKICSCHQFRVTRNSNLWVDDEENNNLYTTIQGELPHRHFGKAVRLEISNNCGERTQEFLKKQFKLGAQDIYRVPGPVNLVRLMAVPDMINRPDLKFPSFRQTKPKGLTKTDNIFSDIRKGDILLHHPYQTFLPVVKLLEKASKDPDVVSIKMTLYRTGSDSVLLEHLLRAARNRKEVTVVIELMARFDEEANLSIAEALEAVGAHVVYGIFGYKTHAKLMMIVRREGQQYKRYCHLGTGNYHPKTSNLYTDFGLITSHDEIADDVANLFLMVTGMGEKPKLKHLWYSPFTLHKNVLKALEQEKLSATAGKTAKVIAKMNSLLEPEVIMALYDAAKAGVTIDLIVRGPCALRPGIKGLSENIRVRSMIGRFLEHHRIFYFYADGKKQIMLSSADWMNRNFFRRVETAFPIYHPALKKRILNEGLLPFLDKNTAAWEMKSDGTYEISADPSSKDFINPQNELLEMMSKT